MNRFRGLALIVNTLLPAIVLLVLASTYVALVRPALEDARTLRASFDRVDQAAAELRRGYDAASTGFGQRIDTIGRLLDPPSRLYRGVEKLSRNFCGNVGKDDLWSRSRGGVQVASLGAIGETASLVGDTLDRLRGPRQPSTGFVRTGACKTTEAAFEQTFTVLATVMKPLQEIDLALGEFGTLYHAMKLEQSFAALLRLAERLGTALGVLGYLALALALWFGVVYVTWAGARLRRGWSLIQGGNLAA